MIGKFSLFRFVTVFIITQFSIGHSNKMVTVIIFDVVFRFVVVVVNKENTPVCI